LRTGRTRTSPEEAAVLLGGAPEEGDVIDVVVDPNDVDSILVTLNGRDWNVVIEPMVGAWHEANQRRDKPQPMPSRDACTTGCRRPAFCGAFPTVGERRPGSNARLIMASKSNLANVTRCERRAAWALVHGIPRQRDDDSANRTSLGTTAHQILASLVLSSDPQVELQQHLEGVLPEDQATVRMFLEHHLGIDEEHDGPIAYKQSEFLIGVTLVVPGYYPGRSEDQGDVAVVLYGLADAVGYEADSTPAIVDHKTTDYEPTYEQDLYAVALAAAFGPNTDRVAVHHHYLGRPESPRCVRSEFGTVELEAATARLRQVAGTIAGWDPLAPSEVAPKQTADSDCMFCPFRDRCVTFGGPQPQ
ncbi:MAG: hypothetical protein HKO76_07955, partial [Acidimicrobiia bacterium]|nr:hypothetical protein [Acidimicrobiia bacterium]